MNSITSNRQLKPPFLIDVTLLLTAVIISSLSLLMIYSTTGVSAAEKFGDPYFFVKRQAVAVIIGFIGLFLATKLKLTTVRKISPYCLLLAMAFVIITFIPGIGRSSGGAQRWINLPLISFQPAEISKILYVIFLAGYFARREEKLGSCVYSIIIPVLFIGLLCALLLKQPDFGSSAIIASVTFSMILLAGVRPKHLLYGFVPVAVAGVYLVATSSYRMKRILAFLSPDEDLLGRGYQLSQSLIAVSAGSWTGVGIGAGRQKLHFLPAAHTDFLFAVVAEEWGFLGGVAIICAFLMIFWRGTRIAKRLLPDQFLFGLAFGLTMLLIIPMLLNIGVVTGVLPTKGLVLPLLGYGGSSMISSLIIIGLLLALAKHCYRNAI